MRSMNVLLPVQLIEHHLGRLFGSQYQHLMTSIYHLQSATGDRAFIADVHRTALAGLYALLHDNPPNNAILQKTLTKVCFHCEPVYCLAKRDNALASLKEAQTLLDEGITQTRQADWLVRQMALDYLQVLQQCYRELTNDFHQFEPPAFAGREPYPHRASVALLGMGYYHVDLETARKLLCINETGDIVKNNEVGAHAVCALSGVHYKPNPPLRAGLSETVDFIKPGKETAVSSLIQLIAGNKLAASPSTLLSIQSVPIFTTSAHGQEMKPESSDAPLKKHATLTTEGLVQAGLTIQGIGFKDFLELRQTLHLWQERLSKNDFMTLLDDCRQNYDKARHLAKRYFPDVFSATEREAQSEALRQAFEGLCQNLPASEQLREIADNASRPEANKRSFFRGLFEGYLQHGGSLKTLHALLGVMKSYPAIMQQQRITDILKQLKYCKRLFTLLPNTALDDALNQINTLLSEKYLDWEAASALWIGLLLSLPNDAKFDNFMLALDYNPQQQLQSCRIVGIDNDLSLTMPFTLNQNEGISLEIKNSLFFLPELTSLPLHPKVRQRLLATTVESQWLTWLCFLARRDSDYQTWQSQGSVSYQALTQLDIPIKLSRQVVYFIKHQWQTLQAFIQNNSDMTHHDCLRHLYPAIAIAYEGLQKMGEGPLEREASLYQFFSMGGACPLERLIDKAMLHEPIEGQPMSLYRQALTQCEHSAALLAKTVADNSPKRSNSWRKGKKSKSSESAITEAPRLSAQEAKDDNTFVVVRVICEHVLQEIDWSVIPQETHWSLIQAFALLPYLKQADWCGKTKGNIKPYIQQWLCEAIYRGNPFIAHKMLSLGASVDEVDEANQTPLHSFCRSYLHYDESETVRLMADVLLSHHSCQPNKYNVNGYTPLLQFITVTPERDMLNTIQQDNADIVLKALIEQGANLEAKDSYKQETALDKVTRIESPKPSWFISLVQYGAGIHADGAQLAAFKQRMQPLLEENQSLFCAFEMLKKRNLTFMWHSSQIVWETQQSEFAQKPVQNGALGKIYMPTLMEKALWEQQRRFYHGMFDPTKSGRQYISKEDKRHAYVYYTPPSEGVVPAPPLSPMLPLTPVPPLSAMLLLSHERRQSIAYQEANWTIDTLSGIAEMEMSVKFFAQSLFGEHTVPHDIFAFFDEKQNPYPVFISQALPGENLNDVLNRQSIETVEALDFQLLSEQLILAMLLHLGQGDPSDYQVLPIEYGEVLHYRLISLNNRSAFIKPVDDTQGTEALNIQSVLFCFDAMRKPVHPAVRERLVSINVDNFLVDWLRRLKSYQAQTMQLFKNESSSQTSNAVDYFTVAATSPFLPGAMVDLWNRFIKLQQALLKNPSVTHLQLLMHVTPTLGLRYEEVFKTHVWPHEIEKRFLDIKKIHYSDAIAGKRDVLGSVVAQGAMSAVAAGNHLAPDMVPINPGLQQGNLYFLSIDPVLEELNAAISRKTKILKDIDNIQRGNIEYFLAFSTTQLKEYALSKLDFSRITLLHSKEPDLKKQRALLEHIKKTCVALKTLTIQHCAVMTDKDLMHLLKNSRDLTKLKLVDCPQLTAKLCQIIEKYTPVLKSLTLLSLPHLFEVGKKRQGKHNEKGDYTPIRFMQLERLNLSENLQLRHIVIQCPQLKLLSTKRNPQLRDVNVFDAKHTLNFWDLSYCEKLTEQHLECVVGATRTPHFNILGCRAISSELLHYVSSNFPELLPRLRLKAWYNREKLFQDCLHNNVLSLLHESVNEREVFIIIFLLKKNPNLVKIDFGDIPLSDNAVMGLIEVLQTHLQLKAMSVKISNVSLFPHLLKSLELHHHIELLTLNEVDCFDVRTRLAHPHVSINLNQLTVDEWAIMTSFLQRNTVLKRLILEGEGIALKQDLGLLFQCLSRNTDLQVLALQNVNMAMQESFILYGLISLFDVNTTLRYVTISHETLEGRDDEDEVLELFQPVLHRHARLRVLKVSPAILSLTQISDLLSRDVLLISPNDCVQLLDALNQTLATIQFEWVNEAGMLAVAEHLKTNPIVKVLDFSGNALSKASLISFFQSVEMNTCLEILDLRRCALQDDEAKLLLHVLEKNTTLKWINLDFNPISSEIKHALLKECFIRCRKENNPNALQKYIHHLQNDVTNDIDLMNNNGDALVAWEEVAFQLYYNEKAQEVGWPHCENAEEDVEPFLNHAARSSHQGEGIRTREAMKTPLMPCIKTESTPFNSLTTCIQLNDGRLAMGSAEKSINLWEVDNQDSVVTLHGHSAPVYALVQLSNGRLASGSLDETIILWSIDLGKMLTTLKGHVSPVRVLIQLKDSRLASGSLDGMIKIWDIDSGQCLTTLTEHREGVCSLIQLEGGRLVSGSLDGTLKWWDIDSGVCLNTITAHTGAVFSLLQLRDGRLVSGSFDKTIKLWDADQGKCFNILEGHTDAVHALIQLQDGRLISGSADKTIKCWDTNRYLCLATLDEYAGVVRALFQRREGSLISVSLAGIIQFWRVNPYFSHVEHTFNIEFRQDVAKMVALNENDLGIDVVLLPAITKSYATIVALKSMASFIKHLLYNCYARNALLYAIDVTLDEENNVLRIKCADETVKAKLYLCLRAFLSPLSSLKRLLQNASLTFEEFLNAMLEFSPQEISPKETVETPGNNTPTPRRRYRLPSSSNSQESKDVSTDEMHYPFHPKQKKRTQPWLVHEKHEKDDIVFQLTQWLSLIELQENGYKNRRDFYGTEPYSIHYQEGDCLFASIAAFEPNETAMSLRKRVIRHILRDGQLTGSIIALTKSNPPEILRTKTGDKSIKSFFHYTLLMSEAETWGTMIEVVGLARSLQRPIAILTPNNQYDVIVEEETYQDNDPIFLNYVGEMHYAPLSVPDNRNATDILNEIRRAIEARNIEREHDIKQGSSSTMGL